MDKLTYTVPELAKVLSIGRNAAYELVQREGFPAIRINERRIIIPRDGLNAWLAEQTGKTNTATQTGVVQRIG